MTFDKPALGLRQGSLSLTVYDPRWAELFQSEAALIPAALPDAVFRMNHIGNTSVPGHVAQPILDMAIRSDNQEQMANALRGLGDIDRGIRSGRLFIRLHNGSIRTHNPHLYRSKDVDCRDQILFRDALRRSQQLRDRYAALKLALTGEFGANGRRECAGPCKRAPTGRPAVSCNLFF